MFKIIGIISILFAFSVPYVSHESVTWWQMILLQISFYAIGYFYIIKMGE